MQKQTNIFIIFLVILTFYLVSAVPEEQTNPIYHPINYSELPTVNSSKWWNTVTLGPMDDANPSQFDNVDGTLTVDESHIETIGNAWWLRLDQSNWFNDSFGWIYWDAVTPKIVFNQSKLETVFYNATALEVVVGTGVGTLADIQTYNSIPYNVSEDASDVDFRVNFSVGVGGEFNQLIVRYKSAEEDLAHVMIIEIYEPDEDEWEQYGTLPGSAIYHVVEFGVFDSEEHVDANGVVQVRIFQDEGAPPRTHLHNFDWVTISKGFGTPAGEEVDPLSIHSDGDVMWMGNERGNGFNSSGWDYVVANVFQFATGEALRIVGGVLDLGNMGLTTTGTIDGVNTEWDTAYDHSQDNSQAHSDYMLNTGDTTTGDYDFTAGNIITQGSGRFNDGIMVDKIVFSQGSQRGADVIITQTGTHSLDEGVIAITGARNQANGAFDLSGSSEGLIDVTGMQNFAKWDGTWNAGSYSNLPIEIIGILNTVYGTQEFDAVFSASVFNWIGSFSNVAPSLRYNVANTNDITFYGNRMRISPSIQGTQESSAVLVGYGDHVNINLDTTGTSTAYGLYFDTLIADTAWGIYNDAGVDNHMGTGVTYGDRIVMGQDNESVNSTLNISSGDGLFNIVYANAFSGRSPFMINADDEVGYTRMCVYDMVGVWNMVWWDRGEIVTETNSQRCADKKVMLDEKQQKEVDYNNENKNCVDGENSFVSLKQYFGGQTGCYYDEDKAKNTAEANCLDANYSYDRQGCFEIVNVSANRGEAVETYQKEIMQLVNVTFEKFDMDFNVIEVTEEEKEGTGRFEDAWRLKDGCGLERGFGLYCEVRELR